MLCKAKIVSKPLETKIFLGETEIAGVRRFEVSQGVGEEIPKLTLEMLCSEVELEVDGIAVERAECQDEKVYFSMNKSDVLRVALERGAEGA